MRKTIDKVEFIKDMKDVSRDIRNIFYISCDISDKFNKSLYLLIYVRSWASISNCFIIRAPTEPWMDGEHTRTRQDKTVDTLGSDQGIFSDLVLSWWHWTQWMLTQTILTGWKSPGVCIDNDMLVRWDLATLESGWSRNSSSLVLQ